MHPTARAFRGQFVGVGNGRIKEEVEERLLGTAVDLKRGVIRPYLISSINAFYKVIIYINKLQNR